MAGGIIGSIAGSLLGPLIPTINTLVERLVPDPVAQQKLQNELTAALMEKESEINKMIAEQASAQAAINLEEAKSPSRFISGWRPAAAWCCVFGLAYSFAFQPLFGWLATMLGAAIGANIPSPPVLNMEVLMGLLTGMLGLGGFRMVEKINGAAAPEPGSPMRRAPPAVAVRR